MKNNSDNVYYEACAIAALQALIKKVPLADKSKGDDPDTISEEICKSADRYAAIMVGIRRDRIKQAQESAEALRKDSYQGFYPAGLILGTVIYRVSKIAIDLNNEDLFLAEGAESVLSVLADTKWDAQGEPADMQKLAKVEKALKNAIAVLTTPVSLARSLHQIISDLQEVHETEAGAVIHRIETRVTATARRLRNNELTVFSAQSVLCALIGDINWDAQGKECERQWLRRTRESLDSVSRTPIAACNSAYLAKALLSAIGGDPAEESK